MHLSSNFIPFLIDGVWCVLSGRDPIESVSGEMAELLPEGPNLYGYAGNNQLNWIDPWGLNRAGAGGPCGKRNIDRSFDPGPMTNFAAGFADSATWGLSDAARDMLNSNEVVAKCSDILRALMISEYQKFESYGSPAT